MEEQTYLDYDIPVEQMTPQDYTSYLDMQNNLIGMLNMQQPVAPQPAQTGTGLQPLTEYSNAGK